MGEGSGAFHIPAVGRYAVYFRAPSKPILRSIGPGCLPEIRGRT